MFDDSQSLYLQIDYLKDISKYFLIRPKQSCFSLNKAKTKLSLVIIICLEIGARATLERKPKGDYRKSNYPIYPTQFGQSSQKPPHSTSSKTVFWAYNKVSTILISVKKG